MSLHLLSWVFHLALFASPGQTITVCKILLNFQNQKKKIENKTLLSDIKKLEVFLYWMGWSLLYFDLCPWLWCALWVQTRRPGTSLHLQLRIFTNGIFTKPWALSRLSQPLLALLQECPVSSLGSKTGHWGLGCQSCCTTMMISVICAASPANRDGSHSPSNAAGVLNFLSAQWLWKTHSFSDLHFPEQVKPLRSVCVVNLKVTPHQMWDLCWEIWTGHFITDCVYSLFCSFACFLLLFHPALRIHNFTVLPSHNSTFVNTNDSAYSNFSATVGEELLGFFCSAFVRRGWFL